MIKTFLQTGSGRYVNLLTKMALNWLDSPFRTMECTFGRNRSYPYWSVSFTILGFSVELANDTGLIHIHGFSTITTRPNMEVPPETLVANRPDKVLVSIPYSILDHYLSYTEDALLDHTLERMTPAFESQLSDFLDDYLDTQGIVVEKEKEDGIWE